MYLIDPAHSTIGLSVRHTMTAEVRGAFTAFEGLLKLDGSRPTRSEAYFSVQTGSLETGVPERDAQVTGPDFLDSATLPLMSFRSTEVLRADGRFRMAGHLRIKDVEAPADLDLEFGGTSLDAYGQHRVRWAGTAVSTTVKLVLDVCAVLRG
ncbi:YceI family protein [Streptomyces sp. DSM 41699]|uniref:YceI family protein n=1 Tax=Streptomyces gibsoniae TaxID=3075529 RepID=A0ABU2U7C0_9ACTN|nr:YceI family protein [Streptomyces sp. DSM 41699]MDT0469131.1 YceI family protein [Streptomyces sp. DSM 41699]